MSIYVVDPDESLDYSIDWDDDGALSTGSPAETVDTSVWAITPDISGEADLSGATKGDTLTTINLAGAQLGRLYRLKNTITTSEGRTLVRSVLVKVAHR